MRGVQGSERKASVNGGCGQEQRAPSRAEGGGIICLTNRGHLIWLVFMDESLFTERKFEMRIMTLSDLVRHSSSRFVRLAPWLLLFLTVNSALKLTGDVSHLEAWLTFLLAGGYTVYFWFPGWFPQPKSRLVVIDERAIRFPVKLFGISEIPKSQVSEVSPITDGLMIAWIREGVPRYTQLPEQSFDPAVWTEFRQALLRWGNRGAAA